MSNIQTGQLPLGGGILGALAENWWLLLLRGLAAIAFGVIAFFWPAITLVALTYLWGAYALADGMIAIGAAFSARGVDAGPRWWLGLSGAVGILAGIIAFAYTGVGNFVGMRWADWTAGGRVPDDVLDDVLELLGRGLAPRDPPGDPSST